MSGNGIDFLDRMNEIRIKALYLCDGCVYETLESAGFVSIRHRTLFQFSYDSCFKIVFVNLVFFQVKLIFIKIFLYKWQIWSIMETSTNL